MNPVLHRRQFFHGVGAAAACAAIGTARRGVAAPPATIRDIKIISPQPEAYYGTVTRREMERWLRDGIMCAS